MARKGASEPVTVCVFCGTLRPENPSPECAHGKTARVQGEAAKAAARLWLALQTIRSYRADLTDEIEREVKAGTGSTDTSPPVRHCTNVRFMRRRKVWVDQLRPVRLA